MSGLISVSQPARHRRAVILCGDARVAPFAQFTAWQITQAEGGDLDFDICFCSFDDIALPEAPGLSPIRVCKVAPGPLAGLPTDARIPLPSYIRILLPELFAAEYDTILYLDTDLFLRGGRISDLFAAANPAMAISAAPDPQMLSASPGGLHPGYWASIGIDNSLYCNTGVMVMQVELCRQMGFEHGVLDYARRNAALLKYHDQTAINGFLKGQWAPISMRWNLHMSKAAALLLIERFDPHILHFTGPSKPWLTNARPHSLPWRTAYAAFFADVLGQPLPVQAYGPATPPVKTPLGAMLWLKRQLLLLSPFALTGWSDRRLARTRLARLAALEAGIAAGRADWHRV